jgi:hypothetical protein
MKNKVNKNIHNFTHKSRKLKLNKRKKAKRRLKKSIRNEIKQLVTQNELLKTLFNLLTLKLNNTDRELGTKRRSSLIKNLSLIDMDLEATEPIVPLDGISIINYSTPEKNRMFKKADTMNNRKSNKPVKTQVIGLELLAAKNVPAISPKGRLTSPYRIETDSDKEAKVSDYYWDNKDLPDLVQDKMASDYDSKNCAKIDKMGTKYCNASDSILTKTIKEYNAIKFKDIHTYALESTHNDTSNSQCNMKLNINANVFKPNTHAINKERNSLRINNEKEEVNENLLMIKDRFRSEEEIDLTELKGDNKSCDILTEFLINESKSIKNINNLYENILNLEKPKNNKSNKTTTISELGSNSHLEKSHQKTNNKSNKRGRNNSNNDSDEEDKRERIEAYSTRLVHVTLEIKTNKEKIDSLKEEMSKAMSKKSELEIENEQLKQKVAKLQADLKANSTKGKDQVKNSRTSSREENNTYNESQLESTGIDDKTRSDYATVTPKVNTQILDMTKASNYNQLRLEAPPVRNGHIATVKPNIPKVSTQFSYNNLINQPFTTPTPSLSNALLSSNNELETTTTTTKYDMPSNLTNQLTNNQRNIQYQKELQLQYQQQYQHWQQQLQNMALKQNQFPTGYTTSATNQWQNYWIAWQNQYMNNVQNFQGSEIASTTNAQQSSAQPKATEDKRREIMVHQTSTQHTQENSNTRSYSMPIRSTTNLNKVSAQTYTTINNKFQNHSSSRVTNEIDDDAKKFDQSGENDVTDNEEIEIQKSEGASQAQDIRFKLTLTTEYEMEERFDNSNNIMRDVVENFRDIGTIEGPLDIKRIDDHVIIINGRSKHDISLLSSKEWHPDCFGRANVISAVLKIHAVNPDPKLMLIGKCNDKLYDDALEWMQSAGVRDFKSLSNNKIELYFENESARNKALKLGYVQAGGQVVKVEEWVRSVELKQCFNCWKYQHFKINCKRTVKSCRYCAKENAHDSWHCPDKLNPENHRCTNCKGRRGHEAGDKMNCLYYINEYLNKCQTEGIEPGSKFKERQATLMNLYTIEDSQNRHANPINNELSINSKINNKIAKTWIVDKLIYQNRGSDNLNQSQILNHVFNDDSVLAEYENNKQRYLSATNNPSQSDRNQQRNAQSNFQNRRRDKNKNKQDSH